MVVFTLRVKFHAGNIDSSVHLVYEFDRLEIMQLSVKQ